MKLIRPYEITAANMTSNIAETDEVEYASTATYALGDEVMWTAGDDATHHRYESLVAGNVGNALTDATKWLDLGPTNRWAMFDQSNGTATTGASIDVSVDVTGRADGLALLGLSAETVQVTMTVDGAPRTNLITYSQDFDNAAWTKTNVNVTANAVAAPNGSMTADTIDDGGASGNHYLNRSTSPVSGTTYTFSIYAKAGTASVLQILLDPITGTSDYCNFDLANGVLGSGTGGTITDAGNGWYRCSITGASDAAANGIYLCMASDASAARLGGSYAGGSLTMHIWGAQLEEAAAATSYIPTTSAAVTTTQSTAYDETFVLQSDSGITSWYEYFSEEIVYASDLILTDLPLYMSPTVRVVIESDTGDVSCPTMVLGQTKELGAVVYGARAGIQDYSKKSTDDFGNYTIVQRAFARRTVLKLVVDNANIDELHQLLASYRTTPLVWVGTDDYACTVVFGFYKDFAVEIAQLQKSYLSLEIEGLT